jgi:hypothetical protein
MQDWDLFVRAVGEHFTTATHEAGHAVAGELLGFRCRYIKGALWRHDRRTTKLLRHWPNSQKSYKQYEGYAIATIAGIAAEAIEEGGGIITDELRTGPGKADYEAVRVMALQVSMSKVDPLTCQVVRTEASLIAEWETKAIELLQANWEWVLNVADAFIEQEGRLSGDDVRSCKPSAAVGGILRP